MIQTGHGRPLGGITLGVLVSLALLLALAPAANAADPYGNVVTATVPRPAGDEVAITFLQVPMTRRSASVAQARQLAVRRVGGVVPRGFAVAAVRARQRGSTVRVRLAAVRTGSASAGPPIALKLRIGGAADAFRKKNTLSVRIKPGKTAWRRGCRQIGSEARSWQSVPGLGGVILNGNRYAARLAVGAGMVAACQRDVPSIARAIADRFLGAVDPAFLIEEGGQIEGFYATWVKNGDGSGKVCVYVRGDRGGSGDLALNGVRTPFTLDDNSGLTRIDTILPPGQYPFTVRWRQPNGRFRESGSSIGVPAGAVDGQGPPEPYSAAGPCTRA